MTNPISFDDAKKPEQGAAPAKGMSFEDAMRPEGVSAPRGITGMARDLAAWGVKGAIGVPEAVVGLADIATGGRVGKALENEGGAVGFRPKQAREAVNDWHSDATKEAQRKFQEAEGIGGKFQAAIENPSNIVGAVVESLPAMGGGAVAARGLLGATRLGQAGAKATAAAEAAGLSAQASRAAGAAASQRAATIAGAAGEGTMMAGSQAEAIRQETKDGLLTPAQAGIAAVTGGIGGLIGGMSGRLANRLGVGDADTMMVQGVRGLARQNADEVAAAAAKSVPRQAIEGAITEGLLEELPQSVAEQLLQNLALDKPWSDGLDDAIVLGVLSGGAMGAGAAGYRGITRPGDVPGQPAPSTAPAPGATVGGAQGWTTDLGAAGQAALRPTTAPSGNGVNYENTRIVPDWDTQPGVKPTPLAGSIDFPTQERTFDTGVLDLQAPIKRSEAMGLDPSAGSLSAAAATAVDGGASDAMQAAAVQAQAAQEAAKAPAPTKAQAEEIDLTDIADPYERAYYESFFADAEDAQIGPEVQTWLQDDTNLPDLDAASNASDEDFLRALGANDQEITDAIASIASQPSRPQEDAQSLVGAQANEPADAGQGAGEAARAQGGQVNVGARGEADADLSVVDRPGLDDAGRGVADTGAGVPETGGQPGAIARAPDAGNAQAAAVGGSGAVNDALTETQPNTTPATTTQAPVAINTGVKNGTQADQAQQTEAKPAQAPGVAGNAAAAPAPPASPKQAKALERVGAGKAFFFSKQKAEDFIADNDLTGTHAVEQEGRSFHVRAAPAKANASVPLAANADATMDAAPAPNPAPAKPSVKARIEAARQARADHFAPGNIVKSYSGHDRVVSYSPPPKEGGNWSVTVQAVVKQGDAWVDAPNESQRTHSTQPGERELKVGPVEKAQAKAADAKAPTSLVQAAKDNGKLEIVTVGDKKPAPEQEGIALAGWTPETGDQGNTIWTKTANSELYTATLDPAASTMEVTVLVNTVGTQIASFKVESSEQAARMASDAVARDVAETKAAKTAQPAGSAKDEAASLPKAVSEAIEGDTRDQKARVSRLQTQAIANGMSLEAKLASQSKVVAAEATMRKMRLSIFDAEDAAVASIKAGNPGPFSEHADLFPKTNEALVQHLLALPASLVDVQSTLRGAVSVENLSKEGVRAAGAALEGKGRTAEKEAEPSAADDLDAMFDDVLAEEVAKDAPKPQPKPTNLKEGMAQARAKKAKAAEPAQRTATQAAASAAKNTASALGNAIDGLGALFGGAGKLGSGLSFDENTYAKAKPLFKQAVENLGDAGTDLKEAMRAVIRMVMDKFGAQTAGAMKPYVVKFIQDMKDEQQSEDNNQESSNERPTIQGNGPKALDGMAAGEGQGLEGDGQSGLDLDGGRDERTEPGAGTDGAGPQGARSGGGGTPGVRAPSTGGSRGGRKPGRVKQDAAAKAAENAIGPDTRPLVEGEPTSAANIPAANFRITDETRLGQGGEQVKFNDNIAAIRTLQAIEQENRRATPQEQNTLARYVGWGGLANAFPDPLSGEYKAGWEARGQELRGLLTDAEFSAARASTRNAHYTPRPVVEGMWRAAARLGFKGGLALETSMGTGNFLGLKPEGVPASFIGVEYDSLTARMAAALYPQATVLHAGFQDVPLSDNAFALSIGNPPYGQDSLRFQFKPELNRTSIHNQFFRASMDALRPGGLQVMVVSRYLMDAKDKSTRLALAQKARLVGAIRLPDVTFKENARTSVVTDIVILQKLDEAAQFVMEDAAAALRDLNNKSNKLTATEKQDLELRAARMPSWVQVSEIADPLGGEPMTVNNHFLENKANILGVLERSASSARGLEMTVRLDDAASLGRLLNEAVDRLPEGIQDFGAEILAGTEKRHKSMSDALRISLDRHEIGHVQTTRDGALERVIERDAPEGGMEMAMQTITVDSPWSNELMQDGDGLWYRNEIVMDEAGKPAKALRADGKPGRNNLVRRVTFENEGQVPDSLRLGATGFARLSSAVGLRDSVKRQIVLETEDAGGPEMEANRKELAKRYADFVARFGPVNRAANLAMVMTMPDGGLVAALETSYQPEVTAVRAKTSGLPISPEVAKPAPMLTGRVIPKFEPATKASSGDDALAISLSETGRVDLERMAQLRGLTQDEVIAELQAGDKPLAFLDPESETWETADAYLSGSVVRKLKAANAAMLDVNIKALEAVQPVPWGAEDVTAMLGSAWVPPRVYADFAEHLTGGKATVSFSPASNTFTLKIEGQGKSGEWDSDGTSAAYILGQLLNSKAIVVKDGDKPPRVDKERTDLAQIKAGEISAEFLDWVFRDSERRAALVALFNEKFNTRVVRQRDGSHLQLPGKVPDSVIGLRRHQKNVIWRGITDNALLMDHAVGAGKTFAAIARAMERRRMGMSRKPMVVVPNHLVDQWATDVYRLYPGAKVLAAGKKDFEAKRRRRLFGRIATGDWDLVIVPHSSFGFIGIDPATEARFLQLEMDQALQGVKEAQEQADEDGFESQRTKPLGVKEAELLVKKIQARMDSLNSGAKDRLLTFEQMGVDDLTVDESHEFKNLYYSSRLTNTRGMGNKIGSRKANDLYNKIRVLQEVPTNSVSFLTGTPISNSAVEMFTVMRYLAPKQLKEMGLEHFDAWRAQFVEASAAFEHTEAGTLKEVTRLGRNWSNMRSLMDLYYEFTDAVSLEDIQKWYSEDNKGKEFPVPKIKGGKRQLISVKPTPAQEQQLAEVLDGFNMLPFMDDPYERNAERLRLMDRARKVSLDARAVDPYVKSTEPGGKLALVSENVKRIYDATSGDKGAQMVFLDRSVPKSRGDDKLVKEYDALLARRDAALSGGDIASFEAAQESLDRYDSNEVAELRRAQTGGWNAYQQIKDNLVAAGIPANEIRFIQEASNDEQKQALFDAVNSGKVRVLLGSSQRMGAGTNAQKKLVALHHVDVTWKPSDIEQREGRIIRQGNELLGKYGEAFEVELLAYATERTVDAKMWDLNATKLKTINGIRKYDGAFTMEFEDADSIVMSEIAALASGNPLLLERVTVDTEITRLELQERAFRRRMYGIKDAVDTAEDIVQEGSARIEQARAKQGRAVAAIEAAAERKAERRVTIEGKEYETLAGAMAAAKNAIGAQQEESGKGRYSLSVNGKRLTTQDSIDEAVSEALGDFELFDATIDGATIAQRTRAARMLTAQMNELTRGIGNEESRTKKAGSMLGFDLILDAASHSIGKGSFQIDGAISLVNESGATVASEVLTKVEVNQSYVPANLRNQVSKLFERIARDAGSDVTGYLKERLERAQRELPELRERLKQESPKAGELKDKRARLRELVSLLEGKAPTVNAPAPSEPSEGAEEVAFSRSTKPGPTFSPAARMQAVQAVEKTANAIRNAWANGPQVVVAFDMQDPVVPESARRADLKQRSGGARGAPEGFYYRGKVYLIASKLNTVNDAARVLFHEALGHHGLRGAFGKEMDGVLNQVATMRRAQVDAKIKEYGLRGVNALDRRAAAEEVLAELAQSRPEIGFVKRAVAAIRTWLRENVPGFSDLNLSDDEIVRSFILPARNWVERRQSAKLGDAGPAAVQRGGDRALWDAKKLTDILEGAAFREKGLRGLEIPQQRVVLSIVARAIHNRKVFDGVVQLVPVDVMNNLTGQEGSSNGLLDDPAMFQNLAIINSDNSVPKVVDEASALVRATAFVAAKQLGRSGQRGFPAGFIPTMEAFKTQLAASMSADAGIAAKGKATLANMIGLAGKRFSATGAGKIQDRHVVTPTSDGVLGAGDVGASSVPPILSGTGENTSFFSRGSDAVRPGDVYRSENGWAITVMRTFPGGNAEVRMQGKGLRLSTFKTGELKAMQKIGRAVYLDGAYSTPQSLIDLAKNESTAPDSGGAAFSRTKLNDLKNTALDQIHQTLSHPGKVSLWDKTVGTMRHLAERNPAFKPVFESAQRSIDDVSTMANDAADHAPRILPRLEGWSDLGKKPVSAADNKAIGKALFEGTLTWARDASGKPVLVSDLEKKYANLDAEAKAKLLMDAGQIDAGVLKMWRGLPIDQFEKLINSRFESKMLKAGVVWSDQELKTLMGMNDQQVSLYREARAALDRSIDMTSRASMLRLVGERYAGLRDVLLERPTLQDAMDLLTSTLVQDAKADPDASDLLMQQHNQVVDLATKARDLMDAGYMPLSRFGKYTLDVVDANGERQYFSMFESKREANLMKLQMASAFPGATIVQGTMSEQAFKLFQGVTPESLEMFGNMLGLESDGNEAKDKAFQAYVQLAKNNHSSMKRLIHRKGIAGYSEDVGRTLSSFVYANARQAAGAMNAGTLEKAIEAIPQAQGELRDVAMGLRSYIQDPQEEGQAVRGMMFAQYLGGSIASAMVNTTQPFAITLPWLSQFGGITKASKFLAGAMKDMGTRGFKYEPDLANALQAAQDDGTVSPQEIHQLMAQSRGAGGLRSGDGTRTGDARAGAANAWERTKVVWGQPFALAEQFNRRSTFIAAYRMAKDNGHANPAEFARNAVLETQFVYSKANKMKWGRGTVGGTLLTFKTYSVSYLELMQRTWNAGTPGSPERAAGRRAVGWGMAMLMLMGGAGGLPFMEDVEDLIDAMAQMMGYNVSSKQWRKQAMEDVMGKELAAFMSEGISGLPGAPIDVSGRLGMGNLIPGTGLFQTKQSHTRDMLEMVGPAGDLVGRAFSGAGRLLKGDVAGAALEVSPSAVRNAAKGINMAASGTYTDTKGYKVLDTTIAEALAKSVGFQPKSVAEVQEATSFVMRSKSFYTQTSSEIRAQWAKALYEKDDAAVQRVRERLDGWNQKNPDQRITIAMPDVWKRVREMGKDREQRIADTAPKALRAKIKEDLAQARG